MDLELIKKYFPLIDRDVIYYHLKDHISYSFWGGFISYFEEYGFLYEAIRNSDLEIVKLIVESGADIEAKKNGLTLLMHTILNDDFDAVRLLVKYGADIESRDDDDDWTALMSASETGNFDIVKFLVGEGANVNIISDVEWTAFMIAVANHNFEIAKFLIDDCADIEEGTTVLIHAARTGQLEVIQFIIETGLADIEGKDEDGITALGWASRYGYNNIVKVLLDAGADIKTKKKYFRPPEVTQ